MVVLEPASGFYSDVERIKWEISIKCSVQDLEPMHAINTRDHNLYYYFYMGVITSD